MNLTRKGEYALRSLIKLGLAQELGRPHLSVTELAESEKLPLKFLEQILFSLRTGGFIDTKRGKYGGYYLARSMDSIRIGDIIRHVDGKLAPIACASQTAYEKCSCPDETHCGLRMLMIDVRNAISNILDRYTLANVVEVTLRKIRRNGGALPFADTEGEEADLTRALSRAADFNPVDPKEGFLAELTSAMKGMDK
ncbi:RrF2 family transcriptional regulator [Coraliomargarita parva]|uniref:RrF2 family transcriptional regulator n=1 Tax=Coraliomargarita parva TaxID=3014050 RepID=UPI0022B576A2|nr:Rrf2 family transcriptional regulator [Coraliomargarita parva]